MRAFRRSLARATGFAVLPAFPAHAATGDAAWIVAVTGAFAALAVLLALEWHAARRVRLASERMQHLLATIAPADSAQPAGTPWVRAWAALSEAIERQEREARAEAQRLEGLQRRREENEGLCRLAVEQATDGMWEWDLKSGAAWFSPRWRGMLGVADDDAPPSIDVWRARVHPADVDSLSRAVEGHLAGRSLRIEHEHRMHHSDGTWRWVLTRAGARHHASGAPYRLVGLDIDVTARRQVCAVVAEAAESLADTGGDECFRQLVSRFARAVDMEEVFLCECCDIPATRVRMLAYWREGRFLPLEEFDLAGTPCNEVIGGARVLYLPSHLADAWPGERYGGAEAYLGVPCLDSRGAVIGHIACKSRFAMRPELPHDAVMRLFAVRAAMEMERRVLADIRVRGPARTVVAHA